MQLTVRVGFKPIVSFMKLCGNWLYLHLPHEPRRLNKINMFYETENSNVTAKLAFLHLPHMPSRVNKNKYVL